MQTDKQARRLGHRVLQVYKDQETEVNNRVEMVRTSCSKGCSSCCYQLTIVTFPEAVAIAEHLLSTAEGQARLQMFTTQVFGLLGVLGESDLSRESFFKLKRACLFLKNNECSIYPVRPAACRYHFVVSDPKHCAPEAEDPITHRIDLRKYETTVWSEGQRVSKQVGIPFGAAPLPIAVLAALRYIQEGSKYFEDEKLAEIPIMTLTHWAERLITMEASEPAA